MSCAAAQSDESFTSYVYHPSNHEPRCGRDDQPNQSFVEEPPDGSTTIA